MTKPSILIKGYLYSALTMKRSIRKHVYITNVTKLFNVVILIPHQTF